MRESRRYFLYSFLAVFIAAASLLGRLGLGQQEPPVNIEPRPLPGSASAGDADRLVQRLHVDANLVLIPVMVTDSENRLVNGLEKEQFTLYDNKVEQAITHFAIEDAPVSIGLVFDCSGSMGHKMETSRAAVAEFIRAANPEDEFSLVTFNDRALLVADFKAGTAQIEDRLLYLPSRGRTALLDAIYLSMSEMKHAKYPRKAILIISDGGDNASRYTERELKNSIREADIQIFSIGIFEPSGSRGRTVEEVTGPALLNEIAGQSGGRLFEVYSLDQLVDIAAKIGSAIRSQYVLGFTPAADADGKYHRIQVKVARPKGSHLHASFRSGYYAR